MSADTAPPPARRIAVALEASEAGRPVLEACARLAATLGLELEGIFVEDTSLMRLAGLSFLRELRPSSLGEESVSSQRMQRELRTLARTAEHMLEQAARETGVPWSFRVWRGHAGAETLASSLAGEFIGLVRTGRRASLRLWAASGTVTATSRRSLSGISVLYGNTGNAQYALETALHLARQTGGRLTILLPATAAGETAVLKQHAGILPGQYGLAPRFVELEHADAASLARATVHAGTGMLIADAGHPLFRSAGLELCMEALSCPVLLLRRELHAPPGPDETA